MELNDAVSVGETVCVEASRKKNTNPKREIIGKG
jgi:hypothetical protein